MNGSISTGLLAGIQVNKEEAWAKISEAKPISWKRLKITRLFAKNY